MRCMSSEHEKLLLEHADRLSLGKNESLYRQGDPPKGLYCVVRGLLRLSVTASNGREASIGVLEPGVWFGEASCITDTPHDYNAYALADSELAIVRKDAFLEIVHQDPAFSFEFARMVCIRYKWALQWIDSSILLPFPVRLAQKLLWLQKHLPQDDGAERNILRTSQEDLGHMLGISRQSINKQLKKWESEKILRISYGSIMLLNMRALDQVAGEDY